jgi:sugar fermentation stimulation protein A
VNIVVDTMCANAVVGEALRDCGVSELKNYSEVFPEKKVGDSRFDFYLPGSPDIYLEVKSVSMGEGKKGAFPDSVTERGQKHIRELMALKEKGHRVILFFLLMREGGETVTTAKEIDPEYDRLLRDAVKKGLEVFVYAIKVDESGIILDTMRKNFE